MLTLVSWAVDPSTVTPSSPDPASELPVYYFTTLAGRASQGANDGQGEVARFVRISGLEVDAAGNIYVADSGSRTVRKVTPDGRVSTLAGKSEEWPPVDVDGSRAEAQFLDVSCVAVDPSGVVYVSDAQTIRRVGLDGQVSTLAGKNKDWAQYEHYSYTGVPLVGIDGIRKDGVGSDASFSLIRDLATDASGTLYALDFPLIRRITPNGMVTTLAGADALADDGTLRHLSDYGPPVAVPGWALVANAEGVLYAAARSDHSIIKITPDGTATTWVGNPSSAGGDDGPGSHALFVYPDGLGVDRLGNVFICDSGSIRKATPDGWVSTIVNLTAGLNHIAVDAAGNVYGDKDNTVCKMTPDGMITTVAGFSPDQSAGDVDGKGTNARFNAPGDIAVAPDGTCYVADTRNYVIRKIAPDGMVSTFAGTKGVAGYADGPALAARFENIGVLTLASNGTLYVADGRSADGKRTRIRQITPDGVVSTRAGQVDGVQCIAVDSTGTLYLDGKGCVRRVDEQGMASAWNDISPAWPGSWDYSFNYVAFDANDNLFAIIYALETVYDSSGPSIIRKTVEHYVLAKRPAGQGAVTYLPITGLPNYSMFQFCVDAGGNVYAVNSDFLGRIGADGNVSNVAFRAPAYPPHEDGYIADLTPYGFGSIGFDASGELYFTAGGNVVSKGVRASASTIVTQPQSQTVAVGGSVSFHVVAIGVPEPAYQWYRNGTAISGATTNTCNLSGVRAADAGDYTVTVTNELGSVTSEKATLTVTTVPSTPSAGGGGSGGGAPSLWFALACLILGIGRTIATRRVVRAV